MQDIGTVTTPQLHYMVAFISNTKSDELCPSVYHEKLSLSFKSFMENTRENAGHIYVDAANGVGARGLTEIQKRLHPRVLDMTLISCGSGKLNDKVG